MAQTQSRVVAPGVRDWPVLRDLLLRAADVRCCPELVRAVADSPRPAQAWKDRWSDMQGPGRLSLFVVDSKGEARGFVAVYLDGDVQQRFVIVRHLVTAAETGDPHGDEAAHLLLDAVEAWAAQQSVDEIILEVSGDDPITVELLRFRGYRKTGVTRPAFDGIGVDRSGGRHATEWGLAVVPRSGCSAPIFAVAS